MNQTNQDTATSEDPMALFSKRILFEDNHLIVVNKLPSEIVQGDKTGDMPLSDLVKAYIRIKYEKPGDAFLGVVHRIDRPVSGAVVFARTSKALERINAMLQNRELNKLYWAVVKTKPPAEQESLEHYLKKNEKQNKSYVVPADTDGAKLAKLNYRLIASGTHYHLIEIELLTGRHHQIRAQLSAIGCPVKGDLKYGFPRSNPDGSIHLHARSIQFIHPVSREVINITAPVPAQDTLWGHFDEIIGHPKL
jgi:23S rRNA pseudouridine1911/1915/1917 synthase